MSVCTSGAVPVYALSPRLIAADEGHELAALRIIETGKEWLRRISDLFEVLGAAVEAIGLVAQCLDLGGRIWSHGVAARRAVRRIARPRIRRGRSFGRFAARHRPLFVQIYPFIGAFDGNIVKRALEAAPVLVLIRCQVEVRLEGGDA